MKKLTAAAMFAATLAVTSIGASPPASAQSFSFSFNTGDVAFAYRDGYWDHRHHWHRWHNSREAREFHRLYGDRWHDGDHWRYRHGGWRDDDRDGVPNRHDRRPENPFRN